MPHVAVTEAFPNFTGQLIDNGRLKLLEVLGAGAYGKVYKAVDNRSDGTQAYYAVKCLLKPEVGTRQEDFQIREFALHKQVCDHMNIVTFHKVLYDKVYVYVVLDLVEGGDLFSAITEKQLFRHDSDLVKLAFIQLLDAVHHCHEQSVFHRDIKPENVLCSKDGRDIRLADFGLSTQSRVSQDFGCGSSYYMSPECIGKEFKNGRYSTRHSDIWSLGIILTNMISGRNPWRYAMTSDDCFAAFLHDKNFLRKVLPISEGASRILQRIFNLNPLCRISLPELRKEIMQLDTFFMSEVDLALATPQCRGTAFHYAAKTPTGEAGAVVTEDSLEGDSSSSEETTLSVDSEEVFLYASPADGILPFQEEHPAQELLNAFSIGGSSTESDSSVSDADSAGPITPATHAVEPAVEVPDMPEGQNLGQAMGPQVITFHAAPAAKIARRPTRPRAPATIGAPAKQPHKRIAIFKRAVQRLRGSLSS